MRGVKVFADYRCDTGKDRSMRRWETLSRMGDGKEECLFRIREWDGE
jgi:hypothetical protein